MSKDELKMIAFDGNDVRTMLMSLTLLQANSTQEIMNDGEASTLEAADIDPEDVTNLIGQLQDILLRSK